MVSWSGKRDSARIRRAEHAIRRAGEERLASLRDGARRRMQDLYQSDLDRHFWSWRTASSRSRRRKAKKRRGRRRKIAGLVASAAGALGLGYFVYRRLHRDDRPADPEEAQAESQEATESEPAGT